MQTCRAAVNTTLAKDFGTASVYPGAVPHRAAHHTTVLQNCDTAPPISHPEGLWLEYTSKRRMHV